jgi:hypothetical protein
MWMTISDQVKAFFSELAIETFYKGILLWFARSYEAEFYLVILRPFEHY